MMHGCSSWSRITWRRQQVEADESGESLQRRASDGRRQTSRASSYLFFKAILLQKSPFPGKKSARGAPF